MGIKFKCEIKGLDNLEKKVNKIITELPKKVEESIEDIIKNIQGYAIKLEKGQNEEGILVEMVETSTMETKGRIYAEPSKFMADNNTSYLWFEYFRTETYAEMGYIPNQKKHFKESGFTEWIIPVNKVTKSLPYPIVTSKYAPNVLFYLAHEVKSNHFLEDAEFKTRNENKEMIQKKLKEFFEEVCK